MMGWIITTTVFLSVLKAALCFNVDPKAWKFWQNGAAGFGYQVVQRDSDLLVSAPLAQYSTNGRGEIYKCKSEMRASGSCNRINVQAPDFAVNMSLGLTMTSDPTRQNTLACGPTIPKDCLSITMYNGVCFQIDRSDKVVFSAPDSPPECRAQADIAFLLDGSGSVSGLDFTKMKNFIKNLVRSFVGRDAQFAVAQFSTYPQVHYYFNDFVSGQSWESKVDGIHQLSGGTYTARAIQHVVENVFTPLRGSRPNVKKVLVVITDGKSDDVTNLAFAADLAEKQKIVRFAIGVGGAFSSPSAKGELFTIASTPQNDHVFAVENFNTLEQIRQSLQAKIFSIEGSQTSGESLKMEMAQEGFSAAFVPGGIQMAIVGANQWKGGYQQYPHAGQKGSSFEPADIAFLLDGSGSVSGLDFTKMKDFIKNLVRSFVGRDAQFAVAQFSNNPQVHYYFNDFVSGQSWESKVDGIRQLSGWTYTARAIQHVVENVFIASRGSRPNVKKVLVVITDGESNDAYHLRSVADLAEKQKIVRFAIGVGGAFSSRTAQKELNTIASTPQNDHVFAVENFNALEQIRQSLQAKLFSIEGSQTSGESLKMEMAQERFSAAFVPGGIQMAIVGANQWKGGYQQYPHAGQKGSSFEPAVMKPDSYLGYSMTIANTKQGTMTVVGAPRYEHRGVVITAYGNMLQQKIDPFPWQFQTGEYFGAEVCAMDVNGDSFTDIVVISAPMYVDTDREGRVYVCRLTGLNVECNFDSPLVLRGAASNKGRFGSSLAVLPDLNTDGFMDLAVGAPLENDGQGSIYIFHGEGGGRINPTYSQRITGSEVMAGLKFFGISISQSSSDLSGDGLTDLAVGSKGTVVLLRSRPIVMVEAKVSFNPSVISTQSADCSTSLKNSASICFTMTRHSPVDAAQAKITYNLTLDATRKAPKNRAYITEKQREKTGIINVDLQGQRCVKVEFFVESCPEDALNPLYNKLRFTFDGKPSDTNLKPSLAQQAQTTTIYPLGFEINCSSDKCVDDLKVDFNFTSSSEVKVGIDELLDVTVSVENSGENSYNSRVILTYPAGLSFRKFTILQGRIECNSLDSEDGLSRGKTDCTIDKPIFKSNSKAFFIVSYGIDTNTQLNRRISVTANATSGNQDHASSSKLYTIKELDVKYSIFMTIESSRNYTNFTFGQNNLQKPFQQSIVVTNDIRALNFTVVIRVPVKLGDKDIWVDSSSLQIPDCQRDKDEKPAVTDFVDPIQKIKSVDCSVARCSVFKCSRFMGRQEGKVYKISANLSSGWIEQIGLSSAKFLLTSTASLEYDRNQYIFFSTGSNNNPPVHKVEVEVEVYPVPDFTKEIVRGSLGGLVLLALLTVGLYEAGFFKSKYKDMIKDAGGEADPAANEDATAPEQQE